MSSQVTKLTAEQVAAVRAVPLGSMPNKVRLVRTMLSQKQADVCEAVGIKAPYMSAIERGEYKDLPLESVLRPLSEFWGIEIGDLFPARQAVAS